MKRGTYVAGRSRMRHRLLFLGLLILGACGGAARVQCPQLTCKAACTDGGTIKDPRTSCDTCVCSGGQTDGGSCPALSCTGTCGGLVALDPLTGCPTCMC